MLINVGQPNLSEIHLHLENLGTLQPLSLSLSHYIKVCEVITTSCFCSTVCDLAGYDSGLLNLIILLTLFLVKIKDIFVGTQLNLMGALHCVCQDSKESWVLCRD